MRQHIVQLSSGIGSWAVARLLVEQVGRENMTLLCADTLAEDDDKHAFLRYRWPI
jgi:uridine kinase